MVKTPYTNDCVHAGEGNPSVTIPMIQISVLHLMLRTFEKSVKIEHDEKCLLFPQ